MMKCEDSLFYLFYFLVKIQADIFCAVAGFLEAISLISFIGVSNKRVIVQISVPVASFNRIKACINLEAGANRIRRPSKRRSIRNESARSISRGEPGRIDCPGRCVLPFTPLTSLCILSPCKTLLFFNFSPLSFRNINAHFQI